MKLIFQTQTGMACLEYKRTTTKYVVVVLQKDAKYFPEDIREFGAYYSTLKEELYVEIDKVLTALYQDAEYINCAN